MRHRGVRSASENRCHEAALTPKQLQRDEGVNASIDTVETGLADALTDAAVSKAELAKLCEVEDSVLRGRQRS
jgi:hypothetical protein